MCDFIAHLLELLATQSVTDWLETFGRGIVGAKVAS